MKYIFTLIIGFSVLSSAAQIDEIKKSSSDNSSRKERGNSGSGSSSGGSGHGFFLVDMAFNGLVDWQRYKLTKKEVNPSVISFEVLMQGAVQPSSYYVFHPRVRGNWGLFSMDYRVNYLVQEDIDGYKDLTTLDWQILQFNVVTVRNVMGRVGFGIMQENFGGKEAFPEFTGAVSLFSNNRDIGGTIEYRNARDLTTQAVPRRELSAYIEKHIFSAGRLHGFATLGGLYQRYYSAISVWGVQGGFNFKIY